MSTVTELQLSPFASDVLSGLLGGHRKKLPPKYFYDDLGSKLFEAITLLPEYGLSRADGRLLERCAPEVAAQLGSPAMIAELGSGSGRKTSLILSAIRQRPLNYHPIDVSTEALTTCTNELSGVAEVHPIHADYLDGLAQLSRHRPSGTRLLLLFVGSSVGNFEPQQRSEFFEKLHARVEPGDLFLLGADLVKEVDRMVAAYDDPTGVTAAFNLNVLGRINRELQADFDLKLFEHRACWNANQSRIEMHLVSHKAHRVNVRALQTSIAFEAGETIWTESSHKFTEAELDQTAAESGFNVLRTWTDREWPFAETLWQA